MSFLNSRSMAFVVLLCASCAAPLKAKITPGISQDAVQDPEKLSEEQMRDFLLNAKVVDSKKVSTGITGISRLTLSDGKITHDAGFQPIDEYRPKSETPDGRTEVNFRDSYKYDIAAYELAKILGLGDMMPVTVERKWAGKTGALSWWLPVKLDELRRQKQNIEPPDVEYHNQQWYRMIVFAELVYDTDRNKGNVLYSADWHLWMIDFTRAFRLSPDLENPKNLTKCDRQLLQKLRELDAAQIKQATKKYLNDMEVKGVMTRRNKIVALFDDLVAKKGEKEVLYDR